MSIDTRTLLMHSNLFIPASIDVGSDEVSTLFLPGAGEIIESISSYHMRCGDLMSMVIDQISSGWYYSSLDMETEIIEAIVRFKNADSTYDMGLIKELKIPNPKYFMPKSNIPTPGTNTKVLFDNSNPISYGGSRLPYWDLGQSEPTDQQKTILDHHVPLDTSGDPIVRAYERGCLNYDIYVSEELTEDTTFMIPLHSVKAEAVTSFGKVSAEESTLPDDAIVGVIPVATLARLDHSSYGDWLCTPTEKGLLKSGRITLRSWNTSGSGTLPSHYQSVDQSALESSDIYAAVTKYMTQPLISLGYETQTFTVGTGIFYNKGEIANYEWSKSLEGAIKSTLFSKENKATDRFDTVKLSEILNANDFVENFADDQGRSLYTIPDNTWVPIAGRELVWTCDTSKAFDLPQLTSEMESHHVEGSSFTKALPIYIPDSVYDSKNFPKVAMSIDGKRVETMDSSNLDTEINMLGSLRSGSNSYSGSNEDSGIMYNGTGVIELNSADNIVNNRIMYKYGFYNYTDNNTWSTYNEETKETTLHWTSEGAEWYAGSGIELFNNNWIIPYFSSCNLVLVGTLPAGTTQGTYKFKPFSENYVAEGVPNYTSSYENYEINSSIETEKTDIPRLGKNYVQVDTPEVYWDKKEVENTIYGTTTVQPLLNPRKDKTEVTQHTFSFNLLLDNKNVPLIGYPTVHDPMTLDVSSTGDLLSVIEDLIPSQPYWSDEYQSYVCMLGCKQTGRLWLVAVDLDDDHNYIESYKTIVNHLDYIETPYGMTTKLLGISSTEDIMYTTGERTPTWIVYSMVESESEYVSNLVVFAIRESMEFDSSQDLCLKIATEGPFGEQAISETTEWPVGCCVMYPYLYIPVLKWHQHIYNAEVLAEGWVSGLVRIDLLSGTPDKSITLLDSNFSKGQYSIPAFDDDYKNSMQATIKAIGEDLIKYRTEYDFGVFETSSVGLSGTVSSLTNQKYEYITSVENNLIELEENYIVPSSVHMELDYASTAEGDSYTHYLDDDGSGNFIDSELGIIAKIDYINGKLNFYVIIDSVVELTYNYYEDTLVRKSSIGALPTITSIASISGNIIAQHNVYGMPVLINPVSGWIETYGNSIYPFSTRMNSCIDSYKEMIITHYTFKGRPQIAYHPFMHVCIGDGLPPTEFSTSIDIQDVSFGSELTRMVKLRNNLLRDKIENIVISVPSPSELDKSELLFLGPTENGPWSKTLTLDDSTYEQDIILYPNNTHKFYVHCDPDTEYTDPITLYLNVEFNRATIYFGYK